MREIHLWNLAENRIEHKYSGFKQGLYVVRCCFGGWDERFVISGSEDNKVYIWHKENGSLIQTLEGHTRPVTSVAWSPTNPTMFASASDDHTIRM
jgi:WD40 repeat protein